MTYLIKPAFYIILGAFDIGFAVHNFKSGNYITFGMWTMLAISMVLCMAKYIFTYDREEHK